MDNGIRNVTFERYINHLGIPEYRLYINSEEAAVNNLTDTGYELLSEMGKEYILGGKQLSIGSAVGTWAKDTAIKTILNPLDTMLDENITDITTTIGSFIIRNIRGKFQRSISFTIGTNPANNWMEEALYGILYQYNDLNKKQKLELSNERGHGDGSGLFYRLDDGAHNMKYRKWNIMLVIQTQNPQSLAGRVSTVRIYTIITYDLDPEFVKKFESDMLAHRNSLLKIRADSPTVNVYKDYHENDGYTYWDKQTMLPKRKLSTLYLPYEKKKLLVDKINEWFANKELYHKHGIPWNLKILLYGVPGGGKSTITKVIASEWNRNIYECTGGKNGRFIPNALTDESQNVTYPLFSISDIDKYPALINEPDVEINDKEGSKDEALIQKQIFGNMLNALDGITSGEGKIIVMSTNHIEKFSDAFLRPGRVDIKLEIGPIDVEVFRKYVHDFYNVILPKDIELKKNNLTIAELQKDAFTCRMELKDFLKKYVK